MGSQVSKHRNSRVQFKEGRTRHQDSDESALQGEQYSAPAVQDSEGEVVGGRAAAAHRSPGTWASSAQTLSTPASPAAPSPSRPPHGLPGADTALHERAQAGGGPGGRRGADQWNEKVVFDRVLYLYPAVTSFACPLRPCSRPPSPPLGLSSIHP